MSATTNENEGAITFGDLFGEEEDLTTLSVDDASFNPLTDLPATYTPASSTSLVPPATPSTISPWPEGLILDLALGVDSLPQILENHALDTDDYECLLANPTFRKELAEQVRLVRQEGLKFQRRAQAVAEECLPDMYHIIKDPLVSASTRGDLWKYMVKAGNLEPKEKKQEGQNANQNLVQININI